MKKIDKLLSFTIKLFIVANILGLLMPLVYVALIPMDIILLVAWGSWKMDTKKRLQSYEDINTIAKSKE